MRRPSTGVRSSLKSPVWMIVPAGVKNAIAKPCGHRVRDRDELAVDRADPAALAVGDRDQLGAVEHARFLDAVAGERERQRRAVDRDRDVAEQEGEAAGVVLVRVGEQDRLDPVGVLAQVREVGQHEIDAGHVGVGEHDPAVDEQDPARRPRCSSSCGRSRRARRERRSGPSHSLRAGRYHRPAHRRAAASGRDRLAAGRRPIAAPRVATV